MRDDLRAIVLVTGSDVLIDCTRLTFIYSTGITVLPKHTATSTNRP